MLPNAFRKFTVVVAITAILISLSNPLSASADNPPRKILTGWIPYYAMKTALPDALTNSDLIKEVMPFWYTLKIDSKTKKSSITDLYAPANPSVPISEPLTALRNAGYTIIPTITDGTAKSVLANALGSATQRADIIASITNLVKSNNYDGIDLDFEGFAFVDGNTTWSATAPKWVAFVKELGTELHSINKLLSVSTPYVLNPNDAQKGYYVYAWAGIASSIDRLRIMTYDYSVAKVGPLGPITWTERTIQYAISIMPASKVYVGIPGYGRDWVTAVTGVCPSNVANTVKVGAKAATFVMRDATALAATYGATPTYNEQYGEVTFSYQKTYNGNTAAGLATSCIASRTAWYQDARAWALRAALVTKYRIGGITAWTLGMEEPLAMEAVRQVAKQIAPDQVSVAASINKTTVDYGDPLLINATFTIKDKSPVANTVVRIQGKSATDANWRTLATATTAADGSISKYILIGKSTTLRVLSDATWERSEGSSTEFAVDVRRTIVLNAPASVIRETPSQITGVVRPREAGISINLERLVSGTWKPLGASVNTVEGGNFTFSLPPQQRGILTLRVTAAGNELWPVVTTPTFSIIIR